MTAQRANVTRAVDFQIADLIVTVGEIEGTVQLIWRRDGIEPGKAERTVLWNEFADPKTPAQLEAMAGHLRSIFDGGRK
ncbi:hypothetical protein IQ03_05294 [Gemmobacter caeni]|uniref:Uncharacterized protein n=1 Tax=Gemmobacter caeni TaxID=589035 RepID=A0A2T5ZYD4_9RHOB|nr:hypothetical protein [Gemmobacter caeni]PTX36567.1 hypothetical protein C8N34_1582 [Gemmobacter caeni]TWI87729.1 hypothetical protein IQ03_05294 [Gemmobacter caeni]